MGPVAPAWDRHDAGHLGHVTRPALRHGVADPPAESLRLQESD